jgi:hypothetical protein
MIQYVLTNTHVFNTNISRTLQDQTSWKWKSDELYIIVRKCKSDELYIIVRKCKSDELYIIVRKCKSDELYIIVM